MSDWRTEALGDCLQALLDYRGKSPQTANHGIPVLSAKVVKTSGLLLPIEQTISPDYYPHWMVRGLPRPGDVVMTTEAPMGEVIQLDETTSRYALGQRIVCMRGDPGKLDNTFLRYLLTSPNQQTIFARYATGTTVLGISQKSLRSVPIFFPRLETQVRIGKILSAFDDKIEVNRKMNATLEELTRMIFEDWFVEFGPTRRSSDKLTPHLAQDVLSLFPKDLVNNVRSKGWEDSNIGKIAESLNNHIDPTELDPTTPYIGLEHMPRRSVALSTWEHADKVKSGKSRFRCGDILFGKLRPYFHKVGVAPIDGICSTDIIVVRARSGIPQSYLLACMSRDDFVQFSDKTSDGTKMPRTSWSLLANYKIALPPKRVLDAFDSIAAPLISRIKSNVLESRTLSDARDFLLPRLITGEIDLSVAENYAGKAL